MDHSSRVANREAIQPCNRVLERESSMMKTAIARGHFESPKRMERSGQHDDHSAGTSESAQSNHAGAPREARFRPPSTTLRATLSRVRGTPSLAHDWSWNRASEVAQHSART